MERFREQAVAMTSAVSCQIGNKLVAFEKRAVSLYSLEIGLSLLSVMKLTTEPRNRCHTQVSPVLGRGRPAK